MDSKEIVISRGCRQHNTENAIKFIAIDTQINKQTNKRINTKRKSLKWGKLYCRYVQNVMFVCMYVCVVNNRLKSGDEEVLNEIICHFPNLRYGLIAHLNEPLISTLNEINITKAEANIRIRQTTIIKGVSNWKLIKKNFNTSLCIDSLSRCYLWI